MQVACLDLEGVLVPEVWIHTARKTGIEALGATTRDIPDYDQLMTQRLELLNQHGLTIGVIQEVIAAMEPLPGAVEFLERLRRSFQVIILSDTFYQFAAPLMEQLGHPLLFCHNLKIDAGGRITDYCLRMPDQKREAVRALHGLCFQVIAAGDSYNDTGMLDEADVGILFCPPQNVIDEFPQFPVTRTYDELFAAFTDAGNRINRKEDHGS